jgi:FtsP/CotA-like multicopper oxidase with cupredoxin domain
MSVNIDMNAKWAFIAIAAILLATAVFMQAQNTEAATTRNFTLYGAAAQGWGFTNTSITSPGPTITVEKGDTVNLTLISYDGVDHQFFVSYTNSSSPSSSDPESVVFSGTTIFTFVATNTTGTYTYRCYFHPSVMYGYFTVVQTGAIPEFQPFAMLTFLFLGTGIVALVRRKTRQP